MKNKIIIFSGYNERSLISFIRTLTKHNIEYGIISSCKDDNINISSYLKKIYSTRISSQLEINDIINCINNIKSKLGDSKYVIAPTTESLNRYMLKHKAIIESHNCIIPIVDIDLYNCLSDKKSFTQLCEQNYISVPSEFDNVNEYSIPYVAKPIKYDSNNGKMHYPIIVSDTYQHKKFINSGFKDQFFYQEYIDGRSIYLLYFFGHDGSIQKFSQENFIQQGQGKSILAAKASNFHNTELSSQYEKLFRSVSYHGMIMVEIKICGNKCYMIEANPRFWGPSQLFVDSGINLFEAFLYDWGLLQKKPVLRVRCAETKYFWFGGLIKSIQSKDGISYHNYKPDQFISELPEWLESDVYRKNDTINIFRKEIEI